MPKISEADALNEVVPTASYPLYDPTDPATPDKRKTETKLADIPSVVKQTADSVEITVGAQVGDDRAITVQVKDADGNNLTRTARLVLTVYSSAAATALSSGGSTGLAIGAEGMIIATVVAKKVFIAKTDATGKLTLTFTDSGTDAAYLGVGLADGRETIGAAMTNT